MNRKGLDEGESHQLLENVLHFPLPLSNSRGFKVDFVPLVQEGNTFLSKVFMILEEFY